MIPARWRQGEVAVIGLARSGAAATRLLRARGIAVYASDVRDAEPLQHEAQALAGLGAAVQVGGHDLDRVRRATAVVVSPGVPPEAPVLAAAREARVPVHAEVEVGCLVLEGVRFIATTGSNGKTTTTALVAHLLRAGGRDAEAAGNIGQPLSAVALRERPPEWVALEVSSFQLHDLHHFAPDIGVLTNLSPNHLDRYPSLAAYYADKARLFLHATDRSTWVLNADEPDVIAMTRGVAGRVERFSLRERADAWYERDGDFLMLADAVLLPRRDLPLLGDHNVANALAATLAAVAAGVPVTASAAALQSFRPLPHRLEPIREVGDVLWINDSKATSVAATATALAALSRPLVLILGGRHKGEAYATLAPALARRSARVVAYGEAAGLIEADLGGAVRCERAASFDEAVARAYHLARPGQAVLLSPACSSYDSFRNYEERGERFRALVEAL